MLEHELCSTKIKEPKNDWNTLVSNNSMLQGILANGSTCKSSCVFCGNQQVSCLNARSLWACTGFTDVYCLSVGGLFAKHVFFCEKRYPWVHTCTSTVELHWIIPSRYIYRYWLFFNCLLLAILLLAPRERFGEKTAGFPWSQYFIMPKSSANVYLADAWIIVFILLLSFHPFQLLIEIHDSGCEGSGHHRQGEFQCPSGVMVVLTFFSACPYIEVYSVF